MIVIQDNQIRQERFASRQTPAHCFFRMGLFRECGQHVGRAQRLPDGAALGRELAKQERHLGRVTLDEDTIVVPVPDTGRPPRTPWPMS